MNSFESDQRLVSAEQLGEKKRPPYRWLLIGPSRSGTTIHIDPLSTSAWNTSLSGYKRWVLFPNELPKSLVKGKEFSKECSGDEAVYYFTEVLPKIIEKEGRENLKIIEYIQGPGETIYVPGGWWHAVLNCSDTLAMTQNFMDDFNFENVWRSLRTERKKLASLFIRKAKKHSPQVYERIKRINENDGFKMKFDEFTTYAGFKGIQVSDGASERNQMGQNRVNDSQKSIEEMKEKNGFCASKDNEEKWKSCLKNGPNWTIAQNGFNGKNGPRDLSFSTSFDSASSSSSSSSSENLLDSSDSFKKSKSRSGSSSVSPLKKRSHSLGSNEQLCKNNEKTPMVLTRKKSLK